MVGDPDADQVGESDGIFEGISNKVSDGDPDGSFVANSDGDTEGIWERRLVGTLVGVPESDRVGASDGT